MRLTLCCLWAVCASIAAAQIESNTVTVFATRTIAAQPDVVTFYVNVTAPLNLDVLALVKSAGIQPTDLYNLYERLHPETLAWSFNLSVPLQNAAKELSALAALQANAPQPTQVDFQIRELDVSADLVAANPCPLADMVADARRQAALMASAAGFSLGPVSGISHVPVLTAPQPEDGVVAVVPNAVSGAYSSSQLNPFVVIATCTLAVKFKLIDVR